MCNFKMIYLDNNIWCKYILCGICVVCDLNLVVLVFKKCVC